MISVTYKNHEFFFQYGMLSMVKRTDGKRVRIVGNQFVEMDDGMIINSNASGLYDYLVSIKLKEDAL